MFGLGVTELLVILAIVLLLFGTKKLKNIGGDLGGAIKGFRKAVSTDEEQDKPANDTAEARVIEGETVDGAAAGTTEKEREQQRNV